MLAAEPAAEDGAGAPAADAPTDGKHKPPHYCSTTKYTTNNDDYFIENIFKKCYPSGLSRAVNASGFLTNP